MSEYIAKETLEAEIRRQMDECKPMSEGRFYGASFLETIECAPAADVAQVVHCGDCKFRCDFTDGHCECRRWPNIPMSYQRVDPQFDFCSYGERKETD